MPKKTKVKAQENKESPQRDDSDCDVTSTTTMGDITSLLEEHRASIAAECKSTFEPLASALESIKSTISDHGKHISPLETNVNTTDKRLHQVEATRTTLQKDNEALRSKLVDLDATGRRRNILLLSVPEKYGRTHPTEFFFQLLVDVFGAEVLSSPPELDHAHRSLAAPPGQGERLGPVIMCFHRFPNQILGDLQGSQA